MATVTRNHPPPWPTVNLIGLARRQKKMAHYWLAFDRRVSVRVPVRVCACKHLFERQLCLQMRFRCAPATRGRPAHVRDQEEEE